MVSSGTNGAALLGRLDFGSPALAPVVRMLAANLRREAAAWQPPPGLRLSRRRIGEADCAVLGPDTDAPLPGVLYCHGGGFFLPLQCAALRIAAVLAKELPARVFLPDYRLLPQHPAPAAPDDCIAVWLAMHEHAEEWRLDGRVILYGESAGGALAAGLALCARDRALPQAAGQVLIYPALDDKPGAYPSRAGVAGAAWNAASNAAMWRGYLQDCAPGPHLVPLRAERFANLPPAYIEAAERDILRGEAAAFAGKLRDAGVPAEFHTVAGAVHGFDADADAPLTRAAVSRRVAAMTAMLADIK